MTMNLLDGMPGIPIPYLLRSDGMVTSILFLCILLVSFVLSRGQKHLQQGFKNFILNRERNSMFDEVTAADARHTLLLLFHSTIVLGLCGYQYLSQSTPMMFEHIPHFLLLGGLVLSINLLILIKLCAYKAVNGIFFQKARNMLWEVSFVNLLIWLGILLLPFVLLTVYFDISPQISIYTLGILLILAKIMLFWKCFSNFFEKIHGLFHLILYFCALEILPDLLFWKGMEIISNNLTLNL